VNRLEQDYALKQAALASASAEFDKKMEQQEAVSERLIKVEVKRADAAERVAVDARQRVEEERRVNGELRKRIGVIEAERRLLEEEGRKRVDAEGVKEEQLVVLKGMVAELERINGELVEKGNSLKKRYETNDLVGPCFRYWLLVKCHLMCFVIKMDEEKDFVDWLVRLSQSIYEQDEVAKENELSRKVLYSIYFDLYTKSLMQCGTLERKHE
jgi:hypothetical protein